MYCGVIEWLRIVCVLPEPTASKALRCSVMSMVNDRLRVLFAVEPAASTVFCECVVVLCRSFCIDFAASISSLGQSGSSQISVSLQAIVMLEPCLL
jgi:hypothetical protein